MMVYLEYFYRKVTRNIILHITCQFTALWAMLMILVSVINDSMV